jgi:hypothetical protein
MTFSLHHGIHASMRALALQYCKKIPSVFVTRNTEIRRGISAFKTPGLFRCSTGAVSYWR